MNRTEVARLLDLQDQVISRRQLHGAGAHPVEVRTLLARGELTVWLPGVSVAHPGALTWRQRAWGAVLRYAPAVLDRDSALRAESGPGWRGRDDDLPIQVAVGRSRSALVARPEVELRRLARLPERARFDLHPPRLRVEEAVLDSVAGTRSELDRIEILARAVRSRMTTSDRLLAALEGRARFPDRAWLAGVIRDVGRGAHSVLEHGYLAHVERPHGLPRAVRQLAAGTVWRDAAYPAYDLLVELDGRRDHLGTAARAADLGRDLEAATAGLRTTRLGWAQVFTTPCDTAVAIATLLRYGGWSGSPRPCGPRCVVRASA